MSPQKRNKANQGLPAGWRLKHGAYHFRVPKSVAHHWDGKREFRLGKTLPEAHAAFAQRIGYQGNVQRMEQLCDRYLLEVVSKKKPATQRSNQYSLKRLRRAFEGNRVAAIQPTHIYDYRDAIGEKESQKKANLDLEVLSHMFTKAIEWGLRNDHPMTHKKVTKFSLKHRKVMPLRSDLVALAATLPRKWQLYISLKLWTGRRKGELLNILRSDLLDEGIRFVNNKNTDDVFILAWEPETLAIVRELLAIRQGISSMYLFHTRDGQPYIKPDGKTSGFDSIWQRHMVAAVKAGKVSRRFTEHDMRKVRASDLTPAQAQHLLRHTNARQTKTYQVNPTVVSLKK